MQWTCTAGHCWELSLRGQPATSALHLVCPVCGQVIAPRAGHPAWGLEEEAETLPPPPVPPRTHGTGVEAATLAPAEDVLEAVVADGPEVPGYEVLGELGRGGMGVVYKARHVRLNRVVALKMILAGDHAAPEQVERFRREAEAVAQLQHPHIVQVFEVGEHDGRPYFSLEYVEGGSLAQVLDGTPQPAQASARLVERLAEAVHAAHSRGIVHRDLKPANVLLTTEDVPKVTDFGLAKRLDGPAHPTQSGAIVGTPSYMAPEQAAGKSNEIGPAADVYALGAILYELLTGRPPFRAETPLDTVLQVLSEDPVPPSRLRRQLPRDLETVCLKCLDKEPGRRYTTARALAEDLRRFLADEPVRARRVGVIDRARRWARRRPEVAVTVAVILLGGSIGAVMTWWNMRWARGEASRAMSQLANPTPPPGDRSVRALAPSRSFAGPAGPVRALAFRPDGRALAAAGGDHGVVVWDATTARPLHRLPGHSDDVAGLAFSPDGRRLASASWDQTVRLWDTSEGRTVATLGGHGRRVTGVAFSPDGRWLASADHVVRLWDPAAGQEVGPPWDLGGRVHGLTFSPDGRRLAGFTDGPTVAVLDVATGEKVRTLSACHARVRAVAFLPDGEHLLTAGVDLLLDKAEGRLKAWHLDAGKHSGPLRSFSLPAGVVAFSPDGQLVAAAGGSTAEVRATTSGKLLFQLRGAGKLIGSVAFRPDRQAVACGCWDGTVRLWELAPSDDQAGAPAR